MLACSYSETPKDASGPGITTKNNNGVGVEGGIRPNGTGTEGGGDEEGGVADETQQEVVTTHVGNSQPTTSQDWHHSQNEGNGVVTAAPPLVDAAANNEQQHASAPIVENDAAMSDAGAGAGGVTGANGALVRKLEAESAIASAMAQMEQQTQTQTHTHGGVVPHVSTANVTTISVSSVVGTAAITVEGGAVPVPSIAAMTDQPPATANGGAPAQVATSVQGDSSQTQIQPGQQIALPAYYPLPYTYYTSGTIPPQYYPQPAQAGGPAPPSAVPATVVPPSDYSYVHPGYHDASALPDPPPDTRRNRGGVTEPFPERLHRMLDFAEREGMVDVVSFFPHGRAFAIHKPRRFITDIMPRFFRQTRLTSFQRQLNLYGFRRISQGPDNGGYYHELFLKGRPGLCVNMKRTKVKGSAKIRRDPDSEPNFYAMKPVGIEGHVGAAAPGGAPPSTPAVFAAPCPAPVDTTTPTPTNATTTTAAPGTESAISTAGAPASTATAQSQHPPLLPPPLPYPYTYHPYGYAPPYTAAQQQSSSQQGPQVRHLFPPPLPPHPYYPYGYPWTTMPPPPAAPASAAPQPMTTTTNSTTTTTTEATTADPAAPTVANGTVMAGSQFQNASPQQQQQQQQQHVQMEKREVDKKATEQGQHQQQPPGEGIATTSSSLVVKSAPPAAAGVITTGSACINTMQDATSSSSSTAVADDGGNDHDNEPRHTVEV